MELTWTFGASFVVSMAGEGGELARGRVIQGAWELREHGNHVGILNHFKECWSYSDAMGSEFKVFSQ